MAREITEWSWSHWAGTPEQIVAAAGRASRRLAEVCAVPDGYDPEAPDAWKDKKNQEAWQSAVKARSVEVTLEDREGFTSNFENLSALTGLTERDIDRIKRIEISLGGGAWGDLGVDLRIWELGFWARIAGHDRAWTAGMRHELEKDLKPEKRLHAPLLGFGTWLGVLWGFTALSLTFTAVQLCLKFLAAWSREAAFGVAGFAGIVALGGVVAVADAGTRFELLQAGELPRYQRRKRAVVAVSWAVLASIGIPILLAALHVR
jgi:hypothetical protein